MIFYCYTQTVIHSPELSKQPNLAACTFAKESAPEQSVPHEPEAMKHKSKCVNPLHYACEWCQNLQCTATSFKFKLVTAEARCCSSEKLKVIYVQRFCNIVLCGFFVFNCCCLFHQQKND